MLLEAAMAELREASTSIILNDSVQSTNMGVFRELDKGGQINSNINAMDKEKVIGSTDASTDAISLLQDDHEFVSRMLNREPSNLVESAWFGYKSAEVAAGGVPFQWEAEPGKPKNLTIKEDELELPPPLSLPPIRLSNASHTPASSATQSPLSLTGKMKSLLINAKRSGDSTSSNTPEPTFCKSSSKRSSHRAVKPERRSPLPSHHHGPLQSSISPYSSRNAAAKGEDYAPKNNLNYIAAADNSMLCSPSSSPYYFSPLSNSSFLSQDSISPRASIAQSYTISHASVNSSTYSHAAITSHTSSRASNSSISSVSSSSNGSAMLVNGLLSITSLSDEAPPEENGGQNGRDSPSLASPELEILDEGLTTSHNVSKAETTMAEFINRGGPLMNRSLSTSRVTFADDLFRKAPQKKYYSAQLNALAKPKTNFSPMQDPTCSALDKLFPLRRPNLSKLSTNLASKYGSPDDRRVYEDALDTSLDCSTMTEDGMINHMMASCSPLERPAQEVVIQENDENGFAYSPVASAFVFSPRRSSQNTASNFLKPSSGAHNNKHYYAANGKPELKSILKKTGTNYSQELNGTPYTTPDQGGPHIDSMDPSMLQKRLNDTGSQKISSVLLRFAEAEEQLYNRRRKHHADGIQAPTCLPMCSFLGRSFLCRSKLATHGHHHLHDQ